MRANSPTDVLVVGAGPVGLTMAAELARYGVKVRIVEKNAQRTDKSKAIVVWSRTLELMERMGCAASFLAEGFKVTKVNIVAGEQQIAHISLDHIPSPYPFALMIPQSETERLMEQHLNTFGVKVERNVELKQIKVSSEGVNSTLGYLDGREETLETSWLIGCDGAHSTVRHQLGCEFLGNTLESDWMLADVHLANVPTPGEIHVAWHSEGVLAIFPITGDRYRVIADVGETDPVHPRSDPTLEQVQALLDRRGPGGIQVSNPVWMASFHINERKVSDYRIGRVFLAGDAAHVHSPAGGQGMNTGMQDACNLAWKLAMVCRNIGQDEPLLSSYSLERSAVGDEVLKNAGWLTAMATLRGDFKQSIRNHLASIVFGFAPVRDSMADTMSEITIGYPHSSLNIQGAHFHGEPKPGQRAPIRAGESPVGAGASPRFTLCCEPSEEASRLMERYPNLLDATLHEPFQEGGLWLVRPDGYVAVTAKGGGIDEVETFLKRIAFA